MSRESKEGVSLREQVDKLFKAAESCQKDLSLKDNYIAVMECYGMALALTRPHLLSTDQYERKEQKNSTEETEIAEKINKKIRSIIKEFFYEKAKGENNPWIQKLEEDLENFSEQLTSIRQKPRNRDNLETYSAEISTEIKDLFKSICECCLDLLNLNKIEENVLVILGSLATQQATLYSDIEYIILLSPQKMLEKRKRYEALATLIELIVVSLGESPPHYSIDKIKAISMEEYLKYVPKGFRIDRPKNPKAYNLEIDLINTIENYTSENALQLYEKNNHLSTALLRPARLWGDETLYKEFESTLFDKLKTSQVYGTFVDTVFRDRLTKQKRLIKKIKNQEKLDLKELTLYSTNLAIELEIKLYRLNKVDPLSKTIGAVLNNLKKNFPDHAQQLGKWSDFIEKFMRIRVEVIQERRHHTAEVTLQELTENKENKINLEELSTTLKTIGETAQKLSELLEQEEKKKSRSPSALIRRAVEQFPYYRANRSNPGIFLVVVIAMGLFFLFRKPFPEDRVVLEEETENPYKDLQEKLKKLYKNKFKSMDLFTFNREHNFEKGYVNITLIEKVEEETKESQPEERSARKKEKTIKVDWKDIVKEFSNVTQFKHLVVVGDSGVGKTTFLKYIVYQWAQDELWKERFDWLFWIPLSDLDPAHPLELTDVIVQHSVGLQQPESHFSKNDSERLRQVIETDSLKRALFVVDNYDVSPLPPFLSKNPLSSFIDKLLESGAQKKNVMISSKPYRLPPSFDKQVDKQIEMLGFSGKNNIFNYVKKYFQVVNPERESELIGILENTPHLLEFAKQVLCNIFELNPKLLNKEAVFVDDRSKRVIPSVTDLVKTLIVGLMQKDESIRRGCEEADFTFEQIDRTFSKIENDSEARFILNGLADHAFDNLLKNRGNFREEMNADDQKEKIAELERIRLIRCDEIFNSSSRGVHCEFIHDTFRDFFAGMHLATLLKEESPLIQQEVLKHIEEYKYVPRFERVWWFVSGLLTQYPASLHRFFDYLLREPRDLIGIYEYGLMLRCLDESFAAEFPVKAELVSKLQNFIILNLNKYHPSHVEIFLDRLSQSPRFVTTCMPEVITQFTNGVANQDKNLKSAVLKLISSLVQADPALAKEFLQPAINRLADPNEYSDVKHAALEVIPSLVQVDPALAKEFLWPVINRLADKDYLLSRNAALEVIPSLVQADLALAKEFREFVIQQLTDPNQDQYVKGTALSVIRSLVQADLTLATEFLWPVIDRLADPNEYLAVKRAALKFIPFLVKVDPALARKFLQPVIERLADGDWEVRQAALEVIPSLVQADLARAKEFREFVIQQLTDPNQNRSVKKTALRVISSSLVQADLALAKEFREFVIQQLTDPNQDRSVKGAALRVIRSLVQANPALAKEFREFVIQQLTDPNQNRSVKETALSVIRSLVQANPARAKEFQELVIQQLTDPNQDQYVKVTALRVIHSLVQADPRLVKEFLQPAIDRLADPNQNQYVKETALMVIPSLVQADLARAKEFRELVIQQLTDPNQNQYVKVTALRVIPSLVKVDPALAKEFLQPVIDRLADPNEYSDVKQAALEVIPSLVQVDLALAKEFRELVIQQLADSNQDQYVGANALNVILAVARADLALAKEFREHLIQQLTDSNQDQYIKRTFLEAIPLLQADRLLVLGLLQSIRKTCSAIKCSFSSHEYNALIPNLLYLHNHQIHFNYDQRHYVSKRFSDPELLEFTNVFNNIFSNVRLSRPTMFESDIAEIPFSDSDDEDPTRDRQFSHHRRLLSLVDESEEEIVLESEATVLPLLDSTQMSAAHRSSSGFIFTAFASIASPVYLQSKNIFSLLKIDHINYTGLPSILIAQAHQWMNYATETADTVSVIPMTRQWLMAGLSNQNVIQLPTADEVQTPPGSTLVISDNDQTIDLSASEGTNLIVLAQNNTLTCGPGADHVSVHTNQNTHHLYQFDPERDGIHVSDPSLINPNIQWICKDTAANQAILTIQGTQLVLHGNRCTDLNSQNVKFNDLTELQSILAEVFSSAVRFFGSPFYYYLLASIAAFAGDAFHAIVRKIGGKVAEEKIRTLQTKEGTQIMTALTEMGLRTQIPADTLLIHDMVKGCKQGVQESLSHNTYSLFATVKKGMVGAVKQVRVNAYLSVPLWSGIYHTYAQTKKAYYETGFWSAVDKGTDAVGRWIPGGNTILNSLDRQEAAVEEYYRPS